MDQTGLSKIKSFWDFFDKVYCISLNERPDRQKDAAAQFTKAGLAHKAEFMLVDKHPVDCEQGIYESHMLCIKKGIEANAENILIFEDDITFGNISPKIMEDSINFMKSDSDWKILFLGAMVKTSRKTIYPSIRKIKYRSLSHAYVVNRKFAKKLVQKYWNKVPYDDMLRDLNSQNMYIICPSFAFQSNSRSDNERYLPLDRFRRICGGLQRLQKMNEFFNCNRIPIIAVHVAVLILITLLINI